MRRICSMNCKIDTTPDFARDLHTVLVESDGADITLVTIYDKSDQANISNRELRKLMKKNGLE